MTSLQPIARRLTGTVVSTKMMKTIVVNVERRVRHPKYGKTYTVSRNFKAHDAEGSAHLGDTVEIGEARPMSADKRWQYVRTVTAASK